MPIDLYSVFSNDPVKRLFPVSCEFEQAVKLHIFVPSGGLWVLSGVLRDMQWRRGREEMRPRCHYRKRLQALRGSSPLTF